MPCVTPNLIYIEDPNTFRKVHITVPCGRCYWCLRKRSNEWAFRLYEEAKISNSVYFITLTYNDEHIPRTTDGLLTLSRPDLQKFFKRLRKSSRLKLRYFACGEYGTTTQRPHYHAIIFNLPVDLEKAKKLIANAWTIPYKPQLTHGFIDVQKPRNGAFKYVTKYVMKTSTYQNKELKKYDQEPAYCVMSRGIGENFLTKQNFDFLIKTCTYTWQQLDSTISIPRYYWKKALETNLITEEEYTAIRTKKLNDAEERRQQQFPTRSSWREYQQRQISKADKARKEARGSL